MDRFTGAVRAAVAQENWYAALSLALLIPDICGRLEDPQAKSQSRYVKWYDQWLQAKYTHNMLGGAHVFLSGKDCYALRCALSHEGRGDITDQRAQEVLTGFAFNYPDSQIKMHCNLVNNVLQLSVDCFALDVCEAAETWHTGIISNLEIATRIGQLIKINNVRDGIPGFIRFE